MRIEKTQLEFNEIYKGKVKPIATGGYIPFFKRFIGRIVHIIIPEKEKGFWLLKKEDLNLLKKIVDKLNFDAPYSRQRKEEIIISMNAILKNSDNFDFEELEILIKTLEEEKLDESSRRLIHKIKKLYSI